MVLSLFAGVTRLFLSPKSLPLVLGGIAAAAIVGAGVWGWSTITDLRRDKVEQSLRTENDKLQEQIEEHNRFIVRMQNAQADFEERVSAITSEMENLNRRLSANAARRQQTADSFVLPTVPGQPRDSQALQERANTGMATFFNDLETLSQEKANNENP